MVPNGYYEYVKRVYNVIEELDNIDFRAGQAYRYRQEYIRILQYTCEAARLLDFMPEMSDHIKDMILNKIWRGWFDDVPEEIKANVYQLTHYIPGGLKE